ncbi:S-adenosyl-L-methionine-dependent methyltransferase [Cutaneotrichosporon oleaginosum]|uniref:S-adenosyl-L-methionine-dependent methyltransferase n=1 Tax=Cutaneotrichosporon oleaginosum TaxID=879819 RepID=A0A0J1B591_9TREE|nr:S-adenosyl-L-methionine-dependent methyltransferase [Cutaneotrichosporon oleaginosum]KLT42869.1 S-adenosyl-L-methionine-dependent methyltransferase [Cutaneotrichosporon oleaginosum]TXT08166.1 hypothetical protein COLE_05090 [Cutaneotrichosporon oleaginosum]
MSTIPSPTGSPAPKKVRADGEPSLNGSSAADGTAPGVPQAGAALVKPLKPQHKPQQGKAKRKRNKRFLPDPYSHGDILAHDIADFLGKEYVEGVLKRGDESEWAAPEGLELQTVYELRVGALGRNGDSISLVEKDGKRWAIVAPMAHPGDLIRAKVWKHDRFHSVADYVETLEYCDDLRGGEGDRRKFPGAGCKYFGLCGGCQLQDVPYALQLEHKKRTVDLAYQRYSGLDGAKVPAILDTIGSPKQWAYRTKITPHFDAMPKAVRAAVTEEDAANTAWIPKIGFNTIGGGRVADIEECVIATDVLNAKLTEERQRVRETIATFKRGATLLLRDSLPPPEPLPTAEHPFDPSTPIDIPHVAITNHKAQVYERVGDFLFSFAAGSFFQNNNSILIPLTDYVKAAIFPPGMTSKRPTHLVDTYCGSGLFGITLSPEFERVAGVEISQDSITAAKANAEMNGLGDKTTWLCGKAEDIFGGLAEAGFAGSHSCVVIDPPRKGCDTPFLEQLLEFRPLTAVYVSCNVHTQARDIGWFVSESEKRGEGKWRYVLESLRGFDLFPQTAHVESVGVLRLVEET